MSVTVCASVKRSGVFRNRSGFPWNTTLRGQRHDQRVSPLPSPQIDLIFGLSRRRAQRRVVICISLARRDEI